ncbi:inovirus-type Gp2 protein [Citrobacter braakii]|uniref:YagK/YfjJ domain-containing protein n=1 Tax=Citrobacter braakii TaxID=57706 RepID=UPI0035242226
MLHVAAVAVSRSSKCHYYICLLFNKDVYYHLGDYNHEDNIGDMIIGAWYSTQGWNSKSLKVRCIFQMVATSCWTPTSLTSTSILGAA